jgi:D-3-phosphoglycerate dehydrogenase
MVNFSVVITEPIHNDSVNLLRSKGIEVIELPLGSDEESLLNVAPYAHCFITRGGIQITKKILEASLCLKAVGVHGIGCDHIDLTAAKGLGKIVFNTPDALTISVAEMTVALILSLIR